MQTETTTLIGRVDAIETIAQRLRADLQKWERLAGEILGPAPIPDPPLKLVVRDVILRSPEKRLTRLEIVKRVRERLGERIKSIGIISTLHAKKDFVEVETGVYAATL
jgi:hypothetical protein